MTPPARSVWFHWPTARPVRAVPPSCRSRPRQADGRWVSWSLGLSPLLSQSASYIRFQTLLAASVSQNVTNAIAAEEERKRLQALAELDRAKTAFFSNVSHEFRTPLTLLLGPAEDALADAESLSSDQRERWYVVHRNALRLSKLVNTLLDFSRIEAGRVDASFEPTNLSALTTDLASMFASAVERGGLSLRLDIPPVEELAYVDRELWEKVVFNLLSNALKFTFEGQRRRGATSGRSSLRARRSRYRHWHRARGPGARVRPFPPDQGCASPLS